MHVTVPSEVEGNAMFEKVPRGEGVERLLEAFCVRESQMWCGAENWLWLMEGYKEMLQSTDEETMERLEREMEDEYDAFQDYVDGICQVAEIEDSILTIDPEGWVGEER